MSPSPPPTIVFSPLEGKQDYELVVFERNDPDDPHQWSRRKKRGTVALACLYAFCAVFGSAIYVRLIRLRSWFVDAGGPEVMLCIGPGGRRDSREVRRERRRV